MASDAASQLGIPSQDPIPGASERRDRARSVSADLEAIFGQPRPVETPARARPVGRAPRRDSEDAPRRLSAATLGGLAAAALAGIAAGSLLVKVPHRAAPSAAASGNALPHRGPLPVEMVPPPQIPQASDAALAAPAETAEALAPARHAQAKPRHAGPSAETVRAADRRLRTAYEAAIRAGAPRRLLVDSRDRWASARRREARDPAKLVASYNAIAADLTRAAAHSHNRPARRSLFHPRFASWWR